MRSSFAWFPLILLLLFSIFLALPVRLFCAGIKLFLFAKAEAAAQMHHLGRQIFCACSATTGKKPPKVSK
jgi:hypothetical protein